MKSAEIAGEVIACMLQIAMAELWDPDKAVMLAAY